MNKPKLLLVGVDQCAWADWSTAECTAVSDPYGFDTSGLDVEVLAKPVFDPLRFDGVVFAIPNYHKAVVPLICQALEAGLPTLVHKLRVNRGEDMDPVRRLPEACRNRLFIGEQYQYMPGALALRTAVRSGRCGAVESIQYRCALSMPDRPSWMNAYQHLVLEDLAYHHMSVVRAACGPLHGSVSARSWHPGWLGSVRGYAAFLLSADAGWRMGYDTQWGRADGGDNFFGELSVEGAAGAVWTDGIRATFTARDGPVQELRAPECPYAGWTGIIDHFGDVLAGRKNADLPELMRFDPFDSVLRMLYAAVDSAEQGREVKFS